MLSILDDVYVCLWAFVHYLVTVNQFGRLSDSAMKTLAGYSSSRYPRYWIQAGREEPEDPVRTRIVGAYYSVSYPRPDSNILSASFHIGTRDENGINDLNWWIRFGYEGAYFLRRHRSRTLSIYNYYTTTSTQGMEWISCTNYKL